MEAPLFIYQIKDNFDYYSKFRSDGKISEIFGTLSGVQFYSVCDIKYDRDKLENGVFDFMDKSNLKIESSPLKRNDSPSLFVGLKHDVVYGVTKPNEESYFSVHLQDKYLKPTHYVLRNYTNGRCYWNTAWNLEGSNNNGNSWDILHQVRDSDALAGAGTVCVFKIDPNQCRKCYNQFRIKITQTANDQSWELLLSGSEMYGKMYQIRSTQYIARFEYKKGETKGLFYHLSASQPTLGTDESNACDKGLVTIETSSDIPLNNASKYIGIHRKITDCVPIKGKRAYFEVDLGDDRLFIPCGYVLRSTEMSDKKSCLTDWILEAFVDDHDGGKWYILDVQKDHDSLGASGVMCYFPMKLSFEQSLQTYYTKFRITVPNANELPVSGFELFGTLYSPTTASYVGEIAYDVSGRSDFIKTMNPKCDYYTIDGVLNNKMDVTTSDTMNAWMAIRFHEYKLNLTHYTIKHCDFNNDGLKSWELQGGNDGDRWETISIHQRCSVFTKASAVNTWPVKSFSYFSYFRVIMRGANCSGNYKLCLYDIHFYGHVVAKSLSVQSYKICGYGDISGRFGNRDSVIMSINHYDWFEDKQRCSEVDGWKSSFLKLSPSIPNSIYDKAATFNITQDDKYLVSKLLDDIALDQITIIHLYGPAIDGKHLRVVDILQYDYVGYYFVTQQRTKTTLSTSVTNLELEKKRLLYMKLQHFPNHVLKSRFLEYDGDKRGKDFTLYIDIYNADVKLADPSNEFQVKVLLIKFYDSGQHGTHDHIRSQSRSLSTEFVPVSCYVNSLSHLDWYQHMNMQFRNCLRPEYMPDIIIQIINKQSGHVVAFTRLNFNDVYRNVFTDKDTATSLTSFELINLNFENERCNSILMELHIVDGTIDEKSSLPPLERPFLKFNRIIDILHPEHRESYLRQEAMQFPKHDFDQMIQIVPVIKWLFERNDETLLKSLEFLAAKVVKHFKAASKNSLLAFCQCGDISDCIDHYADAKENQVNSKHNDEYCIIDLIESRLKSQYIPIDSPIDDIFTFFAFTEPDASLSTLITDRLKKWNKDPNDLERVAVSFSIEKELKLIIKILTHRSSNPLNTAIQIADNLLRSITTFCRIEPQINDLIELSQQEAISFLDMFGSNRAKHIALETQDTIEIALDNEFKTFLTSEHVALFRHWKWTENPSTIITEADIDDLTQPHDELHLWVDTFFGSFFRVFQSYEFAQRYFLTLEQQKKYFYSPLGLYQIQYCVFLVYIVFVFYVGMNTRYLYQESVSVAEAIFWVVNISFITSEIFEVVTNDKEDYFADENNWIDLSVDACYLGLLLLRILVLADVLICNGHDCSNDLANSMYIMLWFVLIIMVTVRILYLSFVFQSMGMLIKNIVRQTRDLINFFTVMLLFSFSYGIALYIAIGPDTESEDLEQHSIWWKSVRAMFFGLLNGDVDYNTYTDESLSSVVSVGLQFFILLFSVVAILIILNLIIAVMSGTYEEINATAKQDVMCRRMFITHQQTKRPPILPAPFEIIVVLISWMIGSTCCKRAPSIPHQKEYDAVDDVCDEPEEEKHSKDGGVESSLLHDGIDPRTDMIGNLLEKWICCHCFKWNSESAPPLYKFQNEEITFNRMEDRKVESLVLVDIDTDLLSTMNPAICEFCLRPRQPTHEMNVTRAQMSFYGYAMFSLLHRYFITLPLLMVFHVIMFIVSCLGWILFCKGKTGAKFKYYYIQNETNGAGKSNEFKFALNKKQMQHAHQKSKSCKNALQSYSPK
eukprot:252207_1